VRFNDIAMWLSPSVCVTVWTQFVTWLHLNTGS